tara:strand:+ start:2132 stop:3229 length:1098 start_codon:yes stop_codon:yes gene_type:complete
MDSNEKIQLDDITLDDVISGEGVATEEIAPVQEDEKKVESPDENKLEEENVESSEEVEENTDEEEEEEVNEEEQIVNEKEESSEVDETVVGEILKNLGYEVDEDYEDTSDGLTELTKDIASQMADDRIDEVLDKFPLVKQHLQYVLNGGESENFMQAYDPGLDYNRIELAEDDVRSQKAILSDYFSVKGHDKEFINEMLGDYEDSGKLHNKAEAARQALGKVQAQEKAQLVERQKEQLKMQQAEQSKFWDGVAETLENSKEFAGLQVPEKEKSKFFNYLSKPVTREGYTQRDLDHAEAEMETKLAIDYLMYKGFNLDQIINTKAKTKASKSLRDKISKNEEKVKSARRKSRRSKNIDLDDLDLSI